MRNFLLSILFLIVNLTIAQEKVSSIPLITEKKTMLFEIVDTKAKELLLYQRDPVVTKVLKTNDKLQVIDTAYFETPNPLIFDQYLGHSKKNENYSVYWSNDKRDSIFYQQIDFNVDELKKSKIIVIDSKKDNFLESIAIGSNFYIITIAKKENSLTFHQFNEGDYHKKVVSFEGAIFYHSNDKSSNSIWDVFNDGYVGLQSITEDNIVSLTRTAILKKLYVFNDKEIIFTFDGSAFYTQFLKINMDDFSYSLQNCAKSTKVPIGDFEKLSKTNSFLCNDKLFQIISNSEFATIDIKNLKFETLKTYRIDKDKEIDFINTEVFQENYKITNKRVLDKPSQFIYRLNNLYLGLTCQFINNKYQLKFGAYSAVENPSMYGAMGGLVGALVVASLSSSYSSQSINSYSGRQVVYTNSVLDENLNPVKEKLKASTFDQIRQFTLNNSTLQNPMVFKFDQTTYFGGYDKKTKLLSFYKFND
jgi:hypothetical protein